MTDKKYKFINPNDKNADFYINTFNNYVDNKQYQEAYEYGSMLQYTDPNLQQEWVNILDDMRFKGIKEQQLYENVDESKKAAIDFYDNILLPNGLDKISNNNPYKINYLNQINTMLNSGTKFKIEFQPKEQKLWGIDWLKPDNDEHDIQSFYDKTKLSKSYLESQGIKVYKDNGKDYLEFDASNNLRDKILINVFSKRDTPVYLPNVYILNDNGTVIHKMDNNIANGGFRYPSLSTPLTDLQNIYFDAEEESKIAYDEIIPSERQYSSRIAPNMFGALDEINALLESGAIKTSDHKYKSAMYIRNLISGLAQTEGFNQQEIWYDADNKGTNKLVIDNEEKQKLYDKFVANSGTVKIGTVITGNKVGIHITIPGKEKTNGEITESVSFSIFGDDIEQGVQKFVNNDPEMRAWRETLALEEIGNNYTTHDGKTYKVDAYGKWFENDKPINASQDDIQKIIRKDIDIKNNVRDIVYANVNHNNEIINNDLFEAQLKYAAFATASSINKMDLIQALTPILGNNWNTGNNNLEVLNKVFKLKGIGAVVSEEYEDVIPEHLYGALTELFEIYDSMVARSNKYINR